MNVVIIQELPITLGDFENPATQTSHYCIGSQNVIPLDAILVAREFDPDHLTSLASLRKRRPKNKRTAPLNNR
jgi:hypothetical protein